MALNDFTISNALAAPTFAAPTASEFVGSVDRHTAIYVKNGATASSMTIVIPLNGPGDVPLADKVVSLGTSVERLVKIPVEAVDSTTGLANITFTNVTTVTACLIRS